MTKQTGDSPPRAIDRRGFLGTATLGTGAALAGLAVADPAFAADPALRAGQVDFPDQPGTFGGGGSAAGAVSRAEMDLYDCEVEGSLPQDLDGSWFRVGPDPQYPKPDKFAHDIPFDGEGHVSMF